MSLTDALSDLKHEVSKGANVEAAIAEIAEEYGVSAAKLAKAWETAPKVATMTEKQAEADREARYQAACAEVRRKDAAFVGLMGDFLRTHPQHVAAFSELVKK